MCEDVEEEEEEEEKIKIKKKNINVLSFTSTYQISNQLMQYIPHNIHTSMFTIFKSSAPFISTAVTGQYSCQN